MARYAMIEQSVIKTKSWATGKLLLRVTGLFFLFGIISPGDVLAWIPMAALVSVMIMVALSTFDGRSV